MWNQRGASLLFLMLVVALGVLLAAWAALPWITASRQERAEVAMNRGGAPSAGIPPTSATASERARIVEFAEAHGGFPSIVGTDAYRASSAPCRALIDAYVALLDKPADAAADQPAWRASVADVERRFDAECADLAAQPAVVASGGSQDAMRRLGANLDAYRALSPECRGYVDAFVGLDGQPGLTPSDRDRIAEADRHFTAECVQRPIETGPRPDSQAVGVDDGRQPAQADDGRQAACAQKREEADALRAVVDLTRGEEAPPPGTLDEDRRQRREALEANQSRLQALDAEIASGCP